MLGRLEAGFESQRRFVANASHELRTPLAIQRTLVDVALADPDATSEDLRTMAGSVRDAVDRSERLIDGLVLARSQQGVGATAPVDLAAIAAAAVEQAASEIESAGLSVRRNLQPAAGQPGPPRAAGRQPGRERGPPQRLRRLGRGGDGVTLTVRDGGARVPPDQVAGLFEPFRRLAPDRVGAGRGHGLGLSIVEAVTTAHRGSVLAEASVSGGISVTVSLPATG